MLFRYYYIVEGAHTHVNFFAGVAVGTLGKAGDFCLRNEEFKIFKAQQECTEGSVNHTAEFIDRR